MSRRSLWFLLLSGVATGTSWLGYFRALQLAPDSRKPDRQAESAA